MIPKNIFQTFHHSNFNPAFQNIVDEFKNDNPSFNYQFFTNEECSEFIKTNFSGKIYNAYTRIKPGALKADLWRYCILYEFGGFYIDIDMVSLNGLDRFISKDIDFVSPIDLNLGDLEYHNIFNAFIGCIPKHPIMKNAIDIIINYVEEEVLPYNIMNFTGPGCLGISVNKYLGRKEKESMVKFEGKHDKTLLIKFEPNTEYVRDLDGTKILQNKNNNPYLKHLYESELNKIDQYLDWGSNGYEDVPFPRIVEVDSLQPSKEITTLLSYHNNKSAKFHLYKHCGISDCIRRGFRWEEHQHEVIDKYLNNKSIAVEVGSHIGTITTKLSMVTKKVYAFEPMKPSYDMLNKNLKLNGCNNVKTYQTGIGDKTTIKKIKWISNGNAGGTGLEGGYLTKDSNIDKDIIVDVTTLDSMKFKKVDYLKIDAEGYEELVIKGGEKLIKKDKPLIVMECFNKSTFNSHIKDAKIATNKEIEERFKFLMKLGYIYEHLFFEDFLFIPPHLDRLKLNIER